MRRTALQADDAGIGQQDALELGHRGLHVDQGQHRRREDALLVGVAPIVLEPAVEGLEGGDQGRRVVSKRLLHADPERREQEAPVEALLVHDPQPGVAVAVLRVNGLELTEEGPHVLGARVATSEVLVEAARLRDGIEERVGDEAVDLPAHQQTPATVDLRPLHGPLGHFGIDVAGVGVGRLVVVVVGVEDAVLERRRHDSPRTRRALVRRNLGQTSSLKPTFGISVMILSSDRPMGK